MAEPDKITVTDEMEYRLREFFQQSLPDPTFVSSLEQRLMMRGQQPAARRSPMRALRERQVGRSRTMRLVAMIAAALIVVLLGLVIYLPAATWAQVPYIGRYLTGYGYVNVVETRLNVEPAEVTRDGITLHVEHVVAGAEQTEVVISTEGLPPADELWPHGIDPQGTRASRTMVIIDYSSSTRLFTTGERPSQVPQLLLSDGQRLTATRQRMQVGKGTIYFPPIPEGIEEATLLLPALPLAPEGAAPEGWRVSFVVGPAVEERSGE